MTKIQEALFDLKDIKYRDFQSRLMPTVPKETVIGVRTPELRKMAKQLKNTEEGQQFLGRLPHTYFEENQLHAFMLEGIKDFQACVEALELFLPYVDNWATCDQMSPKIFKKHLPELLIYIQKWIHSEHVYTVRYGIGMLMKYYLDEAFLQKYFEWVIDISSEEYYVNMMIAWYFATALAKQPDMAMRVLAEHRLPEWTHKQTIKKALESYRISEEQKKSLRVLNSYEFGMIGETEENYEV